MIVDLSHEIAAGMTTYPGIAAPELVVTTSRPASAARLTGLEALPDRGARLFALPAPVRGMASFPVRVIAVLGG